MVDQHVLPLSSVQQWWNFYITACCMGKQSCPELAGEAVDYLEARPGTHGLDVPPAPILLLAIDTTPNTDALAALQAILIEARLLCR